MQQKEPKERYEGESSANPPPISESGTDNSMIWEGCELKPVPFIIGLAFYAGLMRVSVVMAATAVHLFHGHDAAFQLRAAHVLKLDGGVAYLKALLEQLVEPGQDAGALRRRNVGDSHVAGQGAGIRAETPDMQVVDVDHSLDGPHAQANLRERDAARRAFQKNIEGLADNAHAAPENERGNDQRESRVDPVPPGQQNPRAAGNHRGGRKRVAGHVNKGRA